ncbi:DnaJ domain-containing protein [Neobacillus sp. 19]|uniref:DnaJ domain-containing protein n=1 Tax=Neobacillus sp. 19 TaxID=3394458 RepID=UPI003BF6AB83
MEKIFIKYNIPQGSSKEEIKRIFRSLAEKYHPDMPTGDEKVFIELRKDLEYLIKHLNMNVSA